MTDKNEKLDILEDVKKIERFKKAQVLAEAIGEIKSYAKEVLVLKEKTDLLLEEIGISKEDSKRIIDYVNSLAKLTEVDKKDIREEVKRVKSKKEEKVEEKMEKNPYPFLNTTSVSASTGASDSLTYSNQASNYTVALGDTGYSIKV